MRKFNRISLQFVNFYKVISTLTLDLSLCFHNRLVCTWRFWNTIQVVFVNMCSNFDRWDTSVFEKHSSVCDHSTGGSNSAETDEKVVNAAQPLYFFLKTLPSKVKAAQASPHLMTTRIFWGVGKHVFSGGRKNWNRLVRKHVWWWQFLYLRRQTIDGEQWTTNNAT